VAKYVLLIQGDAKRWADLPEGDQGEIHQEYMTYTQSLIDAGVMVGGEPLAGADETKTVSAGGVVTDGPLVESSEHLGGFYLIDVADIDAAVQWAGKLPGVARGLDHIEVRPVAVLPDMPTV
jgi:hypothetical protein